MHPAEFTLHNQIARGKTPGLQYLHFNADAVLYRYQGGLARVGEQVPVDRQTTFNGFSVTKTVTAVAVLQLVEAGELALDESASRYLPAFPYPKAVTIRHLLTHTAGIANPIPLRWVHPPAEHAPFDRDAFFREVYAKHPRTAEPNTRFRYSNLGFELLGEIIEAVTGVTYEEYVVENVLSRAGIGPSELGFGRDEATLAAGYHDRRSLSYPILGFLVDVEQALGAREGRWRQFRPYYMNGAAYGGLIGTSDGFARYLQALLDTAGPLLSAESTELLFTENVLRSGKRSGMCLSWFAGSLNGQRYYHHAGGGGGYYSELRIYPSLRRGSVLLCNRTGLRDERLLDRVDVGLLSPGI